MKIALLIIALAVTGCTYTGHKTPLQPGEKIIFNDAERANAFRHASNNDIGPTNRIVEITRPTVIYLVTD